MWNCVPLGNMFGMTINDRLNAEKLCEKLKIRLKVSCSDEHFQCMFGWFVFNATFEQ